MPGISSPKIRPVGASGDQPNGTDGAPGANGTWANFITGATTSDTAFAAAGYVEFPAVDGSGNAITCRIPCFKV